MLSSYPELIIFDMDGVLIDTSRSYDLAVERTVETYLSQDAAAAAPITSIGTPGRLRGCGGFNNDWDLSYALTAIALSRPLIDELGFEELCARVEDLGGGVEGLTRTLGGDSLPEIAYSGDVGTGNRLKQIFQELYLGPKLFETLYDQEPRYSDAPGLIEQESLLIPLASLRSLRRRSTLAIATGRPRAEALYTLELFGMRSLFESVVTLDDCPPGRSKPHPYPLLQAISVVEQQLGHRPAPLLYIGDLPDDRLAARAAAIELGQTVVFVRIGRDELADFELDDPGRLSELLPS